VYLEVTLTNCMISGRTLSSGGDAPSESVSLSYTAVQYQYTSTNADGTMSSTPNNVGYDLGTTTMT
jgi:type VI secretion system secreted protein Hcp